MAFPQHDSSAPWQGLQAMTQFSSSHLPKMLPVTQNTPSAW